MTAVWLPARGQPPRAATRRAGLDNDQGEQGEGESKREHAHPGEQPDAASGYALGLAIGLVYFVGFTGIGLVLALFFQDGLGYSPLRSGLAVTPFALGVAASAVLAGRLVSRVGRWLTVSGLATAMVGLAATALVLRQVGGGRPGWAAAGPLLLAGLGGGQVTSPNPTLTLASVPLRMAGAAGGALQTAQRIGAAIGTALLASLFYRVLTGSGHAYRTAVSDALLCACGLMLLALGLAIAELWHRRRHRDQPTPTSQPQHHHLPEPDASAAGCRG